MSLTDLFPHGLDFAWLATDASGHVAIFTNAGQGPIPVAMLTACEAAERVEQLVRELPERGGCKILVTLPRPDDFIAFARRGLFAYDWQDAHRTSDWIRSYELMSRPDNPVSVEDVGTVGTAIAVRVHFESLRFEFSPRIAAEEHMEFSLVSFADKVPAVESGTKIIPQKGREQV